MNDLKNKSNKFRFAIPIDLENKAKEKAFKLGLIKAGEGILSSYVSILIINDLKNRLPLDVNINNGIKSAETKLVNIRIDLELKERARERAKELGFIRAGDGNISAYIKYLLSIE